jgi:hypothetical protein
LIGSSIHWRLLLQVDGPDKARRKAEEIRRALGRDGELIVGERYWKEDALWECSLKMPSGGDSPAEVVFDCLKLASRIGRGWWITGMGADGDLSELGGVLDVRKSSTSMIPGLSWASFDLVIGA